MKLNGTHQCLAYIIIIIINDEVLVKNTQALLITTTEVG
jgi:hypothetical protein